MILANGRIAELLVHLFRARLDPALDQQTRESESSAIDAELGAAIDAVASLDADRILRQLHAICRGLCEPTRSKSTMRGMRGAHSRSSSRHIRFQESRLQSLPMRFG